MRFTPLFVTSCLALTLTSLRTAVAEEKLQIDISVIAEGNEQWDLTQARTAYVPGEKPFSITTMSRTAKVGAHGFHDIYASYSRDRGESWSEPTVLPPLKRSRRDDGVELACGDLYPAWNAAHKKVLITGKIFKFEDGTKENTLLEETLYAVFDPVTMECGPRRILELPETDHEGKPFLAPNAGCHQRVDLPNGEVMLPVRYQKAAKPRNYTSVVARCEFDGETLTWVEHGSEHSIPTKRGLYEPSVTKFGDEYFLTVRADDGAWVTKSKDGIHYEEHIPWRFDDGELLGSYNTQQHWAEISGGLYLIYTRKGADNDHIMRHRAPLFIAQVDPEKLQVIRSTEQILVPENHATLGNSGVCQISPDEAWITVAEGRVSNGKRAGENNKILLAKVRLR